MDLLTEMSGLPHVIVIESLRYKKQNTENFQYDFAFTNIKKNLL